MMNQRTWEGVFSIIYFTTGLHIAYVNSTELSAVGVPVWNLSTLVYHAMWWVTPVMGAIGGILLIWGREARFAILFAATGHLLINPPSSIDSVERYSMFIVACAGLVLFGTTLRHTRGMAYRADNKRSERLGKTGD